jgi:hypothetical protein
MTSIHSNSYENCITIDFIQHPQIIDTARWDSLNDLEKITIHALNSLSSLDTSVSHVCKAKIIRKKRSRKVQKGLGSKKPINISLLRIESAISSVKKATEEAKEADVKILHALLDKSVSLKRILPATKDLGVEDKIKLRTAAAAAVLKTSSKFHLRELSALQKKAEIYLATTKRDDAHKAFITYIDTAGRKRILDKLINQCSKELQKSDAEVTAVKSIIYDTLKLGFCKEEILDRLIPLNNPTLLEYVLNT